jgi:LuxR family maltose regulon positive regulatory protein
MLIAMLNGSTYEGKPHTLILDDFHFITNTDVNRAVAFLLDHCPPSLRLIIAGRTAPPLPLARLRVRGKLNHIRSTELAFSQHETEEFLTIADLSVNADLLPPLQGWAAGLQFIALAAQESDDPNEQAWLARSYVREFVAQEILPAYPHDVQEFLLHTSILEAPTPDLCDALTGRQDSYGILESLVAQGNFVRRIEEKTYRYARFFQVALQEQLALTSPAIMAALLERVAALNHQLERGGTANTPNDPALSQREHEVLTMLADGLSSPEIARRMIIAVSTVKTHIKHIYRKLEVDNRYQAVKRAQELNIIQIKMEEQMRRMFR